MLNGLNILFINPEQYSETNNLTETNNNQSQEVAEVNLSALKSVIKNPETTNESESNNDSESKSILKGNFFLNILNSILAWLKSMLSGSVNAVEVPSSLVEQKQEIESVEKLKNIQYQLPEILQGKNIDQMTLKNKPEHLKDKTLVALTFDDGPHPEHTEQILDILKQKNVKATFFMTGRRLKAYEIYYDQKLGLGKGQGKLQELLRRIHNDGHVIGNHTEEHDYSSDYNQTAVVPGGHNDINDFNRIMQEYIPGFKTDYYRSPGGRLKTENLNSEALKQGMTSFGWTVDPRDWDSKLTLQQKINNVLQSSDLNKDGGNIVMHDGQAMNEIVPEADLETWFNDTRNPENRAKIAAATELMIRQDTVNMLPTIIDSMRNKKIEPTSLQEMVKYLELK